VQAPAGTLLEYVRNGLLHESLAAEPFEPSLPEAA
jgi:hypothetical protein